MKCVIKNSFISGPDEQAQVCFFAQFVPPTASEAGWVPFEGGGGRLSDA